MNGTTFADQARSRSAVEPSKAETRTGQSRLAYRLAALMLFLGVVLEIVAMFLPGNAPGGVNISIAIDFVLALGLMQLRAGARYWALVRAVLGAILGPILFFSGYDFASAALMVIWQWVCCGGMILLLTGQSKPWRLVLGLAPFVVFYLALLALYGLYLLMLGLGFLP
jgi:hypothetical protein